MSNPPAPPNPAPTSAPDTPEALFTQHMLGGEQFDEEVKTMTAEKRAKLLPAGHDIGSVLTKTLDSLAKRPQYVIRNYDPSKTRRNIIRHQFWSALVTILTPIMRKVKDQALFIGHALQKDANRINKEMKTYIDEDTNAAATVDTLLSYIARPAEARRRNEALLARNTPPDAPTPPITQKPEPPPATTPSEKP